MKDRIDTATKADHAYRILTNGLVDRVRRVERWMMLIVLLLGVHLAYDIGESYGASDSPVDREPRTRQAAAAGRPGRGHE